MARGKSWRHTEDLALVRAIATTLHDAHSLECGTTVFWQRVGAELAQLLTGDVRATPRTPTAVEKRWKTIQAPLAAFTACFEAASRAQKRDSAPSEANCVDAALERFHEADPAHRSFEHLEVWQLLRREMPHYEDLITTSTSFYMIHQRRRVSARGREDERVPALPATKRRRQSTDGNETEAAATAVASRDDDADGSGDCRDRSDDCGGAQDERSAQETPSHAQPPPPSPSQSSRFLSTVPAAEELTTDAAYRRAKLEAAATRNALLAEQNAIAAERNLIALFAHRDDAMSQEFFDLKRSLEIAKLRRPVADT